jgi:26S proteasome regulatory subunit N1
VRNGYRVKHSTDVPSFAGRQEAVEAIIAALEVIPEPFKSMSMTLVEVCAYAGTGNVLKIQNLLHICSEHYEPAEKVS